MLLRLISKCACTAMLLLTLQYLMTQATFWHFVACCTVVFFAMPLGVIFETSRFLQRFVLNAMATKGFKMLQIVIGTPLLVIWLVQLTLLFSSEHVVSGQTTQSYRVYDPQGYESSYLIDGGKVVITCEEANGGEIVFETRVNKKSQSKTMPSPYHHNITLNRTVLQLKEDYRCGGADGGYMGIKAIHCDPFLMSPPVKGCKTGESCLVVNSSSFSCAKMGEDSCFLTTLDTMKKILESSLPKPRRACKNNEDAEDKTIKFGLCHARTVTNDKLLGMSQDAKCIMLFQPVFNGKAVTQDEFLFETKDPSEWTLTHDNSYAPTDCRFYTDKNATVVAFTGPRDATTLNKTVGKSPDKPSKIKMNCIMKQSEEKDYWTVSAFVIFYDKDPSNYAASIKGENSTQVDSTDLVCSCKVPDGFVCGLSWTDPEKTKVDYDYTNLPVRKSVTTSSITESTEFECFLVVFVHEYPVRNQLVKLPDIGAIRTTKFFTKKEIELMTGGSSGSRKGGKEKSGGEADAGKNGDSKSSDEKENSTPVLIYVIAVIVAVVVVAAIVITIFLIVRKTRTTRRLEEEKNEQDERQRQEQERMAQEKQRANAQAEAVAAKAKAAEEARLRTFNELKNDPNKDNLISKSFLLNFYAKKDFLKKSASSCPRNGMPDYAQAMLSPAMEVFNIVVQQFKTLEDVRSKLSELIPQFYGYLENVRFTEILIAMSTWVFNGFPACIVLANRPRTPTSRMTSPPQYLHMNYVHDLYGVKRFVLCQAPREQDMELYLETIIRLKVCVCVTLIADTEEADGPGSNRPRYYNYYRHPLDEKIVFGAFTMRCTQLLTDPRSRFETRTWSISDARKKNDVKNHTLTTISYLKWGDRTCSSEINHITAVLDSVTNFHNNRSTSAQPAITLIHCSAGLGRSGTLVAAQWVRDWLSEFGPPININGIVRKIREDRQGAIQTIDQYIQLYWVAADCLNRDLAKLAPNAPLTERIGAKSTTTSPALKKSSAKRSSASQSKKTQ